MSDVVAAITAMASTAIFGGVTGIKKAFDTVPSGVDLPLPCVLLFPFEGLISGTESDTAPELFGARMTTHHIKAQVLVSQQSDLQDNERVARPFLSRFVTTIDRFKTLNGTANVIDATITHYKYGLIKLRAGDPDYLGWEMTIKILELETSATLYGSTGPAV